MQSFYSNGKLLLTGEYAVLDGALSLAVPTKFGQSLSIAPKQSPELTWKSYDKKDKVWFEAIFELGPLALKSSSDAKTSEILLKILREAQNLNPDFLADKNGYEVETKLDFQRNWGLGTSSTLINNVAQWAKVDAFELSNRTLGGSGYDIACAQNDRPIFYKLIKGKPKIIESTFDPTFKNHLYFIHLNKKQDSRKEIVRYSQKTIDKAELVEKISKITQKLAGCNFLSEFQDLLVAHENLLSKVLNTPKIQDSHFHDFKGSIKSLGAWGGDFILATGNERTPAYFQKKGFATVIPFDDMILKK